MTKSAQHPPSAPDSPGGRARPAEPAERGTQPSERTPPPRQKGGRVDPASAGAQVPQDDAALAPESGDKLGGGPAGR